MRVIEKRQLLSAEEMDRTLQRLAREIVEKSGGTADLALIGIRRRGVPLSERLARAIAEFSRGVKISRLAPWTLPSHATISSHRGSRSRWCNPTDIQLSGGRSRSGG